ncbi:MAG: peptide chain release factor N(5)-glutamine methyltransferase [Patescibacteria group bacterium]
MTTQASLIRAIEKIRNAGLDSATLDAEVLLASVLKTTRAVLLAHPERKLTDPQQQQFTVLIRKRIRRVPVAYLTGVKEFYGQEFTVTPGVLIPRPDTELLVEAALDATRKLQRIRGRDQITLADVGTGSGCIAVTLAKFLPASRIIATDISGVALAVAAKNARQHKVASRITFLQGNLTKPLQRYAPLDIIVANLPYLTPDESKQVPHEPRLALNGGKLGLEPIDRLIRESPALLAPDGIILLEIAPAQTKGIDYLVESKLPGKRVTFTQDLSGRDRVAKIV